MILAGKFEELENPTGIWCYLDIGFSRRETTGIAIENRPAKCVSYATARDMIASLGRHIDEPLNLVIEAPLSVAFDANGNPVGRSCERFRGQTRYWYVGPGAVVTLSTIYLLNSLASSFRENDLRIFEGFVSFKKKASDHAYDADLLRTAVQGGRDRINAQFFAPCDLKQNSSDQLMSVIELDGRDIGIPPVITIFG